MRFHRAIRHGLILVGALAVVACEEDGPPPAPPLPHPSDEAFNLDGVVITRAELEDYTDWMKALDPTMGRDKRTREVLEHLIPLAFARRDLAGQRAEFLELATKLAESLGSAASYEEFESRVQLFEETEVRLGVVRQELPLPEQRWLFEDLNLGRMSPVLETAQGFSLVAATDKQFGVTKAYDRVDAIIVRFYSHHASEYQEWFAALKRRLAELPEDRFIVHPDFRDAIPYWLGY